MAAICNADFKHLYELPAKRCDHPEEKVYRGFIR